MGKKRRAWQVREGRRQSQIEKAFLGSKNTKHTIPTNGLPQQEGVKFSIYLKEVKFLKLRNTESDHL